MGVSWRPKHALFGVFDRIPVVKEMADPIVAGVLGVLVLLTIAGVALPGQVFPHDHEARSHVMQIAAGLVVVFGAYYAAVNIREVRGQKYLERLSNVIDQVGSSQPAVRLGGIRLLQSIALERPLLPSDSMTTTAAVARKQAIREVLRSVSEEGDTDVAQLAALVLKELTAGGELVVTPADQVGDSGG